MERILNVLTTKTDVAIILLCLSAPSQHIVHHTWVLHSCTTATQWNWKERKGQGRRKKRNKQAKTGTNHVQKYLTKHECPEYIMNIYNLIVERFTTWQNIGKRVEQILHRGIFNIYKWPKNTSSLVNREMQIKTAGRHTIGLKTNNAKCCQGWELLVNLNDTSTLVGDMEVYYKTEHHWSSNPTPSYLPSKMKASVLKKTCTRRFTAALFIIAPNCKQPKHLSIMNGYRLWYVCTQWWKRIHRVTRMNLKNIMQNERLHIKKHAFMIHEVLEQVKTNLCWESSDQW